MSLSFWLRDYIYIPMGGSRCSSLRSYFNVMVTFIACGAWHGASWTYIIFGAHHGLWVIVSRIMKVPRERLESRHGLLKHSTWFKSLRIVINFVVCCVGAMYFRANSMAHIVVAWKKWLSSDWGMPYLEATVPLFTFGLLSILIMIYKEHRDEYGGKALFMHSSHRTMRLVCIAATIVFIVLTGALESNSFIYVQF
jgi:D-alanyl-lipoteichoic acid acyltransferase DltB (MBOAT superfamily)